MRFGETEMMPDPDDVVDESGKEHVCVLTTLVCVCGATLLCVLATLLCVCVCVSWRRCCVCVCVCVGGDH